MREALRLLAPASFVWCHRAKNGESEEHALTPASAFAVLLVEKASQGGGAGLGVCHCHNSPRMKSKSAPRSDRARPLIVCSPAAREGGAGR